MTGRTHGSAHEADKMARQWPNQDHKRLFTQQHLGQGLFFGRQAPFQSSPLKRR